MADPAEGVSDANHLGRAGLDAIGRTDSQWRFDPRRAGHENRVAFGPIFAMFRKTMIDRPVALTT